MKYLIGVSVLVLVGCGSSAGKLSSASQVNTQATSDHLQAVNWKVYGPPTGVTVRIVSEVGYCRGSETPRIKVVNVEENRGAVLLTAKRTVSRASKDNNGCADVALGIHKVVTLDHPLAGRALYDSSVSPPAKRWPIPKGNGSS